jgi:hypothetical protein
VRRFGLAILLLAGCTGKQLEPEPDAEGAEARQADEPAADPTREPTEPASIDVEIAASDPPEVTVLVAGRQPREDLRLRPTAGTTETFEMVMTTRMSLAGTAGKLPPTAVPPIAMKGRAIIERSDDEAIAFRYEVDSAEVRDDPQAPPRLVAAMRDQAATLESYSADMRVDAKGGLLGGTVHMPAAAKDPVQQTLMRVTESMGQLQVPLPREPVGVGAKWRAELRIEQAGLELLQTVHYELQRREGDQLFIAATFEQELADASFTPPGMVGAEAKVTRFESKGTGSMSLDLRHLQSTRSEVEMTIDMGLKVHAQGETKTQEMAMIVGVASSRT